MVKLQTESHVTIVRRPIYTHRYLFVHCVCAKITVLARPSVLLVAREVFELIELCDEKKKLQ